MVKKVGPIDNKNKVFHIQKNPPIQKLNSLNTQDIVLALMGRIQLEPRKWLNSLGRVLKDTFPERDMAELKGKKFSEIAQIFSVRFGMKIKSPAELIIALWIYKDRLENLTAKNPMPTFSEILNKQDLGSAIKKANVLMQGQYPFEKNNYLLSIYLSGKAQHGERLVDFTKGESSATLTEAVGQSKINFYVLSQALAHSKETGSKLENSIVFACYLRDHPELKDEDPQQVFKEMMSMLTGEVEAAVESVDIKPSISSGRRYFDYVLTTQEVGVRLSRNKVKETMDKVSTEAEKINKPLREKAKIANEDRAEEIEKVCMEVKVDKEKQANIAMLKKNGSSAVEIADAGKEAYLEKNRLQLLQMSTGAAGISYNC